MERTDEVGAAAAAEYFMRLYRYVLQTGDLSDWEAVSAQGCGFCDRVGEDVTRVYGAGGRYVGGELELGPAEALNQDPVTGGYAVGVPYSANVSAELNAFGEVVREFPALDEYGIVDEIFSSGGWTLVGFSVRARAPS